MSDGTLAPMPWVLSYRTSPTGRALADRHYSRQTIGATGFVPPGSCVVLETVCRRALWVTLIQDREYVDHAWPGAWVCSIFRNEGAGLSSDLIRSAIAATSALRAPPPEGMITFVDATSVRHKRDPGRCFKRAGFQLIGTTKVRELLCFHMPLAAFPQPQMPLQATLSLPW